MVIIQCKLLNNFKSRLVPIKNLDEIPTRQPTCEPAPELVTEPNKHKKSKSKLQQEFINKIIAKEKDINDKLFWNQLKYQNPLFLAKELIRATQPKIKQLVNNVNDGLIYLRNDINRGETPE